MEIHPQLSHYNYQRALEVTTEKICYTNSEMRGVFKDTIQLIGSTASKT